MGQALTNKVLTQLAHAPVAAGAADVTDCYVVDMLGYEGVRFCVAFGAIDGGAATSIRAQGAVAKATSQSLTAGADLAGCNVTVADTGDNKIAILDIYRPADRYVQGVIKRATQNSVVDYAWYELYGAKKLPVTKDANVHAQEIHVSPAYGTA